MRILAMDVGHGTQDNMLYDSGENYENALKVIMPSPSRRFAADVRASDEDIFVSGSQVGGGELAQALTEHAERHRVFMTEECAYTVRNDPGEVRAKGITIAEERPEGFEGRELRTSEPDIEDLMPLLRRFGQEPDIVAIAVQDHGTYPKGESNRRERLKRIRERLSESRSISSLLFERSSVPGCYTRMRSAARNAETFFPGSEIFLMDTAIAAIAGAATENSVVINLGNGHTMCAAISEGRVAGMFEHHTRKLDGEKLGALVRRFMTRELGDEEVFADGGHGCFYLDAFGVPDEVIVTGPNRRLIESSGLGFRYAYPLGDAMMSGPAGMIRTIEKSYIKQ
jgi:uncharacterized protein (DUF1786 family)